MEKKKDDVENIRDYREYGKLSVDIPLKSEDYLLSHGNPKFEKKNGILTFTYLLEKQDNNEVYEVDDS